MQSKRNSFFRGVATGIFIILSWKAFVGGAFITGVFGLAVIAIVSNAALGGVDGE